MEGEWARVILFLGESGRFVQTAASEILYVGGFMGSAYNFKIGVFKLNYYQFDYDGLIECDSTDEKSVQ